jgi:hypothetical protein
VFVGDAGIYSAANLLALSRGLGRYILATPLRKLSEIEAEVLTRPGRYKPIADNLQIKEVIVGEGERCRRYVLCLNPQEGERRRRHRDAVLDELAGEIDRLAARETDQLITPRRPVRCWPRAAMAATLPPTTSVVPGSIARSGQGQSGRKVRRQVRRHHQ